MAQRRGQKTQLSGMIGMETVEETIHRTTADVCPDNAGTSVGPAEGKIGGAA